MDASGSSGTAGLAAPFSAADDDAPPSFIAAANAGDSPRAQSDSWSYNADGAAAGAQGSTAAAASRARPGGSPAWLLPACTGVAAQFGLIITAFAVVLLTGPPVEWHQDPFLPFVFLAAAVGAAALGRLGDTAFGRVRAIQIAAVFTVLGALVPAFTSLGGDSAKRAGINATRLLVGCAAGGLCPLSAAAAAETHAAAEAGASSAGGDAAASWKAGRRAAVASASCWLSLGSCLARVAVWLVILAADPKTPGTAAQWTSDQSYLLAIAALPGVCTLTLSLHAQPAGGSGAMLFRRMAFRSAFLRRPKEMRRLLAGVGGSWCFFAMVYFSMQAMTPSLLEHACFRGHRFTNTPVPFCSLTLAEVALQVVVVVCMGFFGTIVGVGLLGTLGSRRLNVLGFLLLGIFFFICGMFFDQEHENPQVLFVLICVMHFLLGFGPYVGTYVLPAVCFPAGVLPTCHGLSASAGMLGGALGAFFVTRVEREEETKTLLEQCLWVQILFCVAGATLSHALLEREDSDYRGAEEDSATELAYSLASPLRRRLTMRPGGNQEEVGGINLRLSEQDLELITNKGATVMDMLSEEDERKAARDGSPTSKSYSSVARSSICSRQDNRRTSFGSKLFQKAGADLGDPSAAGLGFACKKGLKPDSPNQDSWFVLKATDDISIYGVFDGHGRQGHDCSEFVKENLPKLLIRDQRFWSGSPDIGDVCKDAFRKMQALIAAADQLGKLEATFSGSTATVAVHDHRTRKLTIAHIADSAAVLASVPGSAEQLRNRCLKGHALSEFETEEAGWSCSICAARVPAKSVLHGCRACLYDLCDKCHTSKGALRGERLTQDHRPEMEEEKIRIEAAGGCVLFDGYANHRVYAANSRFPGLNMSRSFGDLMGHIKCGLSCEPVIREVDLTAADRLLLICSDGVWEFINAQRSVDLLEELGTARLMEAAERVAEESWEQWIKEEGGSVVDDITVVMIRLDEPGQSSESNSAP